MNKTRLILLLSILSACSVLGPPPKLSIATDATFAPFHFIDDAGATTGFGVELARAVAAKAGFESKIVVRSYSDLFSGLLLGSHDVVAATTGITAERQRSYLFSDPYFSTCQVAVVRSDATNVRAIANLAGLRIGAAGDGTSARAMRAIDGIHVRIEDGSGVEQLHRGLIDAWIVDEYDGVGAARHSNDRLRVLPRGVASEQYGFVLAKDGTDLLFSINRSLAALENDGTVEQLRAEFGIDRDVDWPVICGEK